MIATLIVIFIFGFLYLFVKVSEIDSYMEYIDRQVKDLDRSLDENIDYLENKIDKI